MDSDEELLEVGAGDHSAYAPAQPGPCKARAGDGRATVWWTLAPAEEDDDDVLRSTTEAFVVRKYRLDGDFWVDKGACGEAAHPVTTLTVEALTNDRHYRFGVRARNRKGALGPESIRTAQVTPYEPLPEPWTQHFDGVNQQTYYLNTETQQKTLVRPTDNVYAVGAENRARFKGKEISKMRLRFSELDEDESGSLDEQEMAELCKELDLVISRPKVRKLMRLVDVDGDKAVNFDEFLSCIHHLRSGAAENPLTRVLNGRAAKQVARLVGGAVTKNLRVGEAARLERQHKQKMMSRERMGDWVHKYDEARRRHFYFHKGTKEKSWKVPREVMWFVSEDLRAAFSEEELDSFQEQFERFDADGSGEMDSDEVTEAFRSLGEDISHNKVLKLVREVDTDDNGSLCFAEFVQLLHMRRERSKGIQFERLVGVSSKNDRQAIDGLRREVFEAKQENHGLRKEVAALTKECRAIKKTKLVLAPVIPAKHFLQDLNLGQYIAAMAHFGVRDTSDLFRLEEDDLDGELGLKLGHKRKLLAALKRLEERIT